MTANTQRHVLVLLLATAAGLCALWGWQSYGQSKRQLEVAMTETAACRQLISSIDQFRRSGEIPVAAGMPEDQLYQRMHDAAEAAGLDDRTAIRSVHPQPPRTVRGSSFQEMDVMLGLQGVTMEQLVRFLHHLCMATPQLKIVAIDLHEPKGSGTATLWNVEPVTLTYRVDAALSDEKHFAADGKSPPPSTQGMALYP